MSRDRSRNLTRAAALLSAASVLLVAAGLIVFFANAVDAPRSGPSQQPQRESALPQSDRPESARPSRRARAVLKGRVMADARPFPGAMVHLLALSRLHEVWTELRSEFFEVESEDGTRPLSELELSLDRLGEELRGSTPTVITASDGSFSFANLPPESYLVAVVAPGWWQYERVIASVRLGKLPSPVTVNLEPALTIEGAVVRTDGVPLTGFMVRASRLGGVGGVLSVDEAAARSIWSGAFLVPAAEAAATESGSFSLAVPEGEHLLEVGSSRQFRGGPRHVLSTTIVVAPAVDVTMAVPPQGTLFGRVVARDAGGAGVEGARVEVTDLGFEAMFETSEVTDAAWSRGAAVTITDGEGYWRLEGLRAGAARVVVTRAGYRPARFWFETEPGEESDAGDQEIVPALLAERVVAEAADDPVGGADVQAIVLSSFAEPESELRPDLARGAISGRVMKGDGPAAAARVKLIAASRHETAESVRHVRGRDVQWHPATRRSRTDAGGDFRFDGVKPGRYLVVATDGEEEAWEELSVRGDGGPGSARGSAPRVHLQLYPVDRSVYGRVVDRHFQPVAAARVKLFSYLSLDDAANSAAALWHARPRLTVATTVSDLDGNFRFAGLPPGDYFVQASAAEMVVSAAVAVIDGETVVRLDEEARLSLVVVASESGRPMAEFTVTLRHDAPRDGHEPGAVFERTVLSPDGRFEIGALRAGGYALSIEAPGYLSATSRVDLAFGERLEQRLVLRAARQILGVVKSASDGSPVRAAQVTVFTTQVDSADDIVGAVTTDSRGAFELDVPAAAQLALRVRHKRYRPYDEILPPGDEVVRREVALDDGLSLAGKLVLEGEREAEHRLLFVVAKGRELRRSAVTNERGEFRFVGLQPGRYELYVPPRPSSVEVNTSPDSVDVEGFLRVELELEESVFDLEVRRSSEG